MEFLTQPEFWAESLIHGLFCGLFCSAIHLLVDYLKERKHK